MVACANHAVRVAKPRLLPLLSPILYVIGCSAGGLAIGLTAAIAGSQVLASARLPAVLLVALCGAVVVQAAAPGAHPPLSNRQVDARLFVRPGPAVASLLWGLELGFAVTTVVGQWAFWAFLAALAYGGSASVALMCGVAFGATRGAEPLVSIVSRHSGDMPLVFSRRRGGRAAVAVGRYIAVSAAIYLAILTVLEIIEP